MAKHLGKDGNFKVGTDAVANMKSWQWGGEADDVDLTAMTEGNKDIRQSYQQTSGTCTYFADPDDTNGQAAFVVGAQITINMFYEGDQTGDKYWQALNASIKSIDHSNDVSGPYEGTMTWTGSDTGVTLETMA